MSWGGAIPAWAAMLGAAGFAALAASFLVINLGLRLIPAGRAFLAAARAEGRLLANPGRRSAPAVKAVFALAVLAALLAGVAGWQAMAAALEPAGPLWPIGPRVAEMPR